MTGSEVPTSVRDLAIRRPVAKGEVVFRVGAQARHVYFLLSGRVALHRFGPDGEEVPIHVAEAGEFFAEAREDPAVADAGGDLHGLAGPGAAVAFEGDQVDVRAQRAVELQPAPFGVVTDVQVR